LVYLPSARITKTTNKTTNKTNNNNKNNNKNKQTTKPNNNNNDNKTFNHLKTACIQTSPPHPQRPKPTTPRHHVTLPVAKTVAAQNHRPKLPPKIAGRQQQQYEVEAK
jgi:hypothetical protein